MSTPGSSEKAGPRNTRDALMAELFGEVDTLLSRCEAIPKELSQVANDLGANTNALLAATEKHRAQVDDMIARVRVETAAMLTKTTEHAANALVGQQTAVLQQAASSAVNKAIHDGLGSRLRKYFVVAVLVAAVLSAAIVIAAMKLSA